MGPTMPTAPQPQDVAEGKRAAPLSTRLPKPPQPPTSPDIHTPGHVTEKGRKGPGVPARGPGDPRWGEPPVPLVTPWETTLGRPGSQYLRSSEEVLNQRSHHLHPQLHLPARLLKGGRGHRTRPQVELRLLLGKRGRQGLGVGSSTGDAARRPRGSVGAPAQVAPVHIP